MASPPAIRPLRFARTAPQTDKMKDAKVALDVIIRPSIQLWKFALRRSVLKNIVLKRHHKTVIPCDDASSTSSSQKKKVRFDEQPVTITTRKRFFERYRKDSSSSSSPARPCLVIREYDDVHPSRDNSEPPTPESDCRSIYEDCFSDYSGFVADLYVLDSQSDSGDERCWDMRPPKRNRRSDFYVTESGIATFDRAGYAHYCLAQWLEKQREEAWSPKKLVFKGPPAQLPQPDRSLPPPPPLPPLPLDMLVCSTPLPSTRPKSLVWRIYKYVEDELENAFAVLAIGLFIHICLFLFLLYDILTRGLVPSDD